ncbi:MAG: hypothetical protein D6773_15455, partial [Alphaproteobacteria bacterium]
MKDDAPFLLECPSCRTRYEVPVAIPEGGRKVRCAKCEHVWTVMPEDLIRPGALPAWDEEEDDDLVFRETDEPEPEPVAEPEPEPEPGPEPEEESTGADLGQAGVDDLFATDSAEPPEEMAAETPEETPEETAEETAGEGDPAAAQAPEEEENTGYEAEKPSGPQEDEAEEERDPVAEFYGDDGTGDASAAPTERIVIGKARRRVRLPGAVALGWAALCMALFALGFGAISQRVAVVRALPGTAPLYRMLGYEVNVRGLEFRDVAYNWENNLGRLELEVHG